MPLVAASLLLWAGLARADDAPFTQDALDALARQSIDVLALHAQQQHVLLQSDKVGRNVELLVRSAPARFATPTGVVDGGLTRFGLSNMVGLGSPRERKALWVGILADYLLVTDFPNAFRPAPGVGNAAGAQLLGYGGVVVGPVSANGGVFLHAPVQGLDPTDPPSEPLIARSFLDVRLPGGASVSAIGLGGPDGEVEGLRGLLQPEALWERLGVREAGLFGLAVQRFEGGGARWGERRPPEAPVWELPLLADDLFSRGFLIRVTPEISPALTVRRVEAGGLWRGDDDGLIVGGRAGVHQRAGDWLPSVDTFVSLYPEWYARYSRFGVPRIQLSWSYNSPDQTTFFALPDAHVFGVQWVYGNFALGRPIVPVFRPTPD